MNLFRAVLPFFTLHLLLSPLVFSRDYRILVLPSGGATGVISATMLAHLEKDTGRPIYQLFDGIAASSIGSMIGSLLVTPRMGDKENFERTLPPMSAEEVVSFLENTFSTYHSAFRIRTKFKKYINKNVLMNKTLIPIYILSAEVISW